MISLLKDFLQKLSASKDVLPLTQRKGQQIYLNGQVLMLTQSRNEFNFMVNDEYDDFYPSIFIENYDQETEKGSVVAKCECDSKGHCEHTLASLMQLAEELGRSNVKTGMTGKAYTREGMKQRVLAERKEKTLEAPYRIDFSANPHGEHILTNEKAVKYFLTFRNIKEEQGYCSCPDYRSNKLGTCKHLMFAFAEWKSTKRRILKRSYPFVEIYLDPLNEYKITYFYPNESSPEIQGLIKACFGEKAFIEEEEIEKFLDFIRESEKHKQILIRPEVLEKTERFFNRRTLNEIEQTQQIDYSPIKAKLYDYQREGVQFATFREAVLLADEMGLGKTLQSITTAIAKKQLFGFKRTLIVCPASLKGQWKSEIEKFSNEKAEIVQGKPAEREKCYFESDAFFLIVNYETILRDSSVINKMDADFIILDEAQRIKNYETRTAQVVKSLKRKHALVITGTPLENRIADIYSIVDFLDKTLLAPLWEFSYQHCYFDETQRNRITGYYNLQGLKEKLKPVLLRREKRDVIKQLPEVQQIDIPVEMHPKQAEYHASYANGIAQIIQKKHKTPYDMQRLMLLLSSMRMVCNSTFLVDGETHFSPKLEELRYILTDKLDLQNNNRKIIIFSEWVKMHGLIGKLLRDLNIGFTELNGKIPVNKRQDLVNRFFTDDNCQVFLSTEAGGSGLNLQAADTVINFELPWNPAKKNQRIGRIDRLGQKAECLTVLNLITRNSIEMQILSGIGLKQNLFDGILNEQNLTDEVDFSAKGRAQFLDQLTLMLDELMQPGQNTDWKEEEMHIIIPDSEAEISDTETDILPESAPSKASPSETTSQKAAEMEQVMNQGLSFLSGMFKMMTGKDIASEEQKIEINRETGEVVMRFKFPL